MKKNEINKLYELKCLKRNELTIINLAESLETIVNKNTFNKCNKHLERVYKEIEKEINKKEKKFKNKKIDITIDDILLIL